MRGCGEKTLIRIVTGTNVRVGKAGNHGEVVAELLQYVEVRREFIVFADRFGEEKRWMQPQRCVDANHAARACGVGGTSPSRSQSIKKRQRHRDACGT